MCGSNQYAKYRKELDAHIGFLIYEGVFIDLDCFLIYNMFVSSIKSSFLKFLVCWDMLILFVPGIFLIKLLIQ